MNKAKSNNKKTIGINYFYELFLKRKRLFPVSYFFFPLKTRKKKIPLEKKLFKKIVKTYLNIYFNEFYYEDTPKYFMLSGMIKKTKGTKSIIRKKNKPATEFNSVCWVWFFRPSITYFSNVRILKLRGTSGKLIKLDSDYKLRKDIHLLEKTNVVIRELKENNKMYKNA